MSSPCNRRFALGSGLAFLSGLALSGCTPFSSSSGKLFTKSLKIPPIGLPPNAIQLDIVYIERPLGDARLGEELWANVDQIASITLEHREILRKNGFRVGVAASNPPIALQQMLRERADFVYEPEAEQVKGLVPHRSVIPSGGKTDVQTSRMYPECSIELSSANDSVRRSYANVVCKYRITATRIQDGWAKLDFVPQIHHGDEQLRPTAESGGWIPQTKQNVRTFFDERFDVKLSIGEMALVTVADEAPGTLGELFFRGPQALYQPNNLEEADAIFSGRQELPSAQRLLVVRLAGVAEGDSSQAAKA